MSAENFDSSRLRGVSVSTVVERAQEHIGKGFSPRTQDKLLELEQSRISEEGEPLFLYEIATSIGQGVSLHSLAKRYGIYPQTFNRLVRAAEIPYASREEAVQRLWNDPDFREKNGAAQAEVRGKYWQDPKKRESASTKLRASALKQWEDPAFRELVVVASSETSKQHWQDPEYRAKMAEHGFPIGRLMSDPEVVARISETRRRQWENPEYRERIKELSRKRLAEIKTRPSYRQKRSEMSKAMWQRPGFREMKSAQAREQGAFQKLWADPDFRVAAIERSREAMNRLNANPENRAKVFQARRDNLRDPEFSSQYSEMRRQIALSLWEDPGYRTKLTDIHIAQWQDPEYRDNQGAALRAARLDPANRDRMVLPTIHGFRSDVGFYAQSAWEANVARVFQIIGRNYAIGANLRLEVTEDFQDIFQASETIFNVDFSTVDNRGRTVMYELMAHPLEDPEGWAKLEMARRQYPELVIRAIAEGFYERLRDRFEDAINDNPQFHGWERTGLNLRTHPEIFG